jgi:hypothetical protein
MPRIPKATTRHELDRVIVGNQLLIMRALHDFVREPTRADLDRRVIETQSWWREHFSEDVSILPPAKE